MRLAIELNVLIFTFHNSILVYIVSFRNSDFVYLRDLCCLFCISPIYIETEYIFPFISFRNVFHLLNALQDYSIFILDAQLHKQNYF